jgi:hypothetical protein
VDEMPEPELEDFHDPGMHVTWLVNDTEAFFQSPGPTSDRDRALGFGLTHPEWLALYFDVLGADRAAFDRFAAESAAKGRRCILAEFDEEISGYPMLSRINGIYWDAVFERDEVEFLRQECLQVRSSTSNATALKGLEKLVKICDWAQRLNLSIFLMCD